MRHVIAARLRPRSLPGWLSIALFVASLMAVIALLPIAASSNFALGKHKLAFFIPPFSAMLFLTLHETTGTRLARPLYPILFMVVLMVPLVTLWNQGLIYRLGDDPYDYSRHAHYMVSNRTWEGELARHPFSNQILIRYVFAAEFVMLGGEKVAVQIINLMIFFTALMCLYFKYRAALPERDRIILMVGLLLLTPYATKNVLYGLTEWLGLSLMFAYFMLRDDRTRSYLAYVSLGLAVIARLNLLPLVLLLSGYDLLRKRATPSKLAAMIAALSFPLVHNVYFYGAWSYLPEGRGWPVPDPAGMVRDFPALANFLVRRALLYTGYPFTTYDQNGLIIDQSNGDWLSTAMGMLFLPYFVCCIFYFFHSLKGAQRPWYVAAAAAMVGPTLILGNGSYPRFQFVNVTILFALYFSWKTVHQHTVVETVPA